MLTAAMRGACRTAVAAATRRSATTCVAVSASRSLQTSSSHSTQRSSLLSDATSVSSIQQHLSQQLQHNKQQPNRSFSSSSAHVRQTECGLHVDMSLPRTFDKILIANRGEIACRIIRTCRELGVRTVAVYSDADEHAQHVLLADEAYRIGEAAAAKSYLLGEVLLDVAARSGAQAIHPGYGFLSENAVFAEQCAKANVKFVGPPTDAIVQMGSKSASKNIMIGANVPVVPGYHGDAQDMDTLKAEAEKCGFPLMIKAVLGGGGKGMRIVHTQDEFVDMLDACKRESMASFNDDRVLLERYITQPRHIEFQVFADAHGNAVHLFERDCSVQRRHQKVLEEAPAPGMSDALRAEMGKSATDAALAVGYEGAGTVEFIFDAATDEYFFMEMNTRLQVEHPVTEMIMRRDLVQWQLHAAAGHKLPATQEELNATPDIGHAIEARIYAEDPDNDFLPATGKLAYVRTPTLANCRVETGVVEGDHVSIFYDPMISKLVVWAATREAALTNMHTALQQYQIVGPPNNIPFLERCVRHSAFSEGQVLTSFIPTYEADLLPEVPAPTTAQLTLATLGLMTQERQTRARDTQLTRDPHSPWSSTASFRLNAANDRDVTFVQQHHGEGVDDTHHTLTITANDLASSSFTVRQAGGDAGVSAALISTCDVKASDATDGSMDMHEADVARRITARVGDQIYKATVVLNGTDVHVLCNGVRTRLCVPVAEHGGSAVAAGQGVLAPMAGKLVSVKVKEGDVVARGDAVAIMEAMKMEHVLRAPKDGVVGQVFFFEGDFVEGNKVVVALADEE